MEIGTRQPGLLEELARRRHEITLKGEQGSADQRIVAIAVAIGLALLAAVLLAGVRLIRPRPGGRVPEDYERLAAGFPGALLVFDRRLRHSAALGRGVDAMGVDPAGKTLYEAFPADVCMVFGPAYRAALDGMETQLELPIGGRDWLITVSPNGPETGLLVATDLTERKRRERRLNDLAARDPLTGASNKRRLTEELEWLNRSGGVGSLLVLDLDEFKQVNDTLGHSAGDQLLCRVVAAVHGCVRRADLVARTGGDEFAVLLPGATPEEAQMVAEKIRTAVAAVWPLGVVGGVSIGISSAGGGTGDALGRADRAMYADKRRPPRRLAS
jgi:diguanylate cyclase (GGDEF)-like protein